MATNHGAGVLSARLEELGWSAARLSREIGAAPPVVSRWLSGDRTPSLEWALRLRDAVQIPVETWVSQAS